MIQITKRDGRKEEFNTRKIVNAMVKSGVDKNDAMDLALQVVDILAKDNNYEIISGHRRFCVATQIGIEKLPIYIKDLNDDEKLFG